MLVHQVVEACRREAPPLGGVRRHDRSGLVVVVTVDLFPPSCPLGLCESLSRTPGGCGGLQRRAEREPPAGTRLPDLWRYPGRLALLWAVWHAMRHAPGLRRVGAAKRAREPASWSGPAFLPPLVYFRDLRPYPLAYVEPSHPLRVMRCQNSTPTSRTVGGPAHAVMRYGVHPW